MKETFRSRFGLIVALVGMAVGTGNIWRFPRIMAQNGGGTFLIPWIIFLFLWSVPLLMVEFSLGKNLRKGVVGCFHDMTDGKLTWLGGFVVFCTLGIMFYYSVVTGWCLSYMIHAVKGTFVTGDVKAYWETFTQTSNTPLYCHIIVIFLTAFVILRGVRRGIEAVSRFVIPFLFIILIGLAAYALTLKGAPDGLQFIFGFDLSKLAHHKIWLEALTQSAWSTGAGWGLALTYSCYARPQDSTVRTPIITGLSNNTVEILAVLAILPTLFTFFPLTQVVELTSEGNTGLTFIVLPGLFQQMPFGQIISVIFFTSLFFAAFTSLISMFELGVSFFVDLGLKRKTAIIIIGLSAIVIGAPSAMSMTVFDNQDWVWGVGLLVSGFFFTILVRYIGGERFIEEIAEVKNKFLKKGLKILIYWIIPLEFFALLFWWFHQAIGWDPNGWWQPFETFSIGTCLFQWGLLILILFLFNRKISSKIKSH